MTWSFAKDPAPFVADGIDDSHADDALEPLELSHDDCPVRPWAGPRDVEMIPSTGGGVHRLSVGRYPQAKGIVLSLELAGRRLLIRKLRLCVHTRPSEQYGTGPGPG